MLFEQSTLYGLAGASHAAIAFNVRELISNRADIDKTNYQDCWTNGFGTCHHRHRRRRSNTLLTTRLRYRIGSHYTMDHPSTVAISHLNFIHVSLVILRLSSSSSSTSSSSSITMDRHISHFLQHFVILILYIGVVPVNVRITRVDATYNLGWVAGNHGILFDVL